MSDLIINNHIINEPIINILRQLRIEIGNDKLRSIDQRGDDVRITCPFHKDGDEKHPSMEVYCGDSPDIEYGTCHCFTCGTNCGLYHLVAYCFGRDDDFGKQWLVDNYGKLYYDEFLDLEPIELYNNKEVDVLDESILDNMQSYHPYMTKRKLNQKVCEKFKVKYEPKTQCIVFPVWDEKNRLVMCTRRSVNNKTFIIDANKEKPVYLYNFVKEQGMKEVTIVESQINCLTLWGWGYPSCALFGTGTKHQYDVLNKSGITHYYLALDGDAAGDKGTIRFLENINKDVFVDIILIPRGKDVNDLTQDEFERLDIVSREDWLYGRE